MPHQEASLALLVHPHQLEVQEFSSYALVVDARSRAEFAVDHIADAINVPVRDASLQLPPKTHASIDDSESGLPKALAAQVDSLDAAAPLLVYCDRGGLDSLVWAEPLRSLGRHVDVLPGGWINYRRWVTAGLEILPRSMRLLRLFGAPGSATQRVLAALAGSGHQVIDMASVSGLGIAPGVPMSARTRLTQSGFETRLLDALRTMDTGREVWIAHSEFTPADLSWPPALRSALNRASTVRLDVPLAVRVRAWRNELKAAAITGEGLIASFKAVKPAIDATMLDKWRRTFKDHGIEALLAAIVVGFIDASFVPQETDQVNSPPLQVLSVKSLSVASLAKATADLSLQSPVELRAGNGSISP